jgi:hypothetical protein
MRSAAGGAPVAMKRGAVNASSSLKTTLYFTHYQISFHVFDN